MKYTTVLTIAGTDPTGGAGVQADIKSISANGGFATSAITAVLAQNTMGVIDVLPLPIEFLKLQIRAVLDDVGTDAVKIGMLHSVEVIRAVADMLIEYKSKNIVLDPVMVATSGDRLLNDDAINTLEDVLIPMARVITPNLREAETLLRSEINSIENMEFAARTLSEKYDTSVLIKGGHLDLKNGIMIDVLYNRESENIEYFESKRIETKNTHGTGCTLSSAIATFLAKGYTLNESVKEGQNYIYNAIKSGAEYKIGKGHGPVNHFWKYEIK